VSEKIAQVQQGRNAEATIEIGGGKKPRLCVKIIQPKVLPGNTYFVSNIITVTVSKYFFTERSNY
jgi:hypothetical protein